MLAVTDCFHFITASISHRVWSAGWEQISLFVLQPTQVTPSQMRSRCCKREQRGQTENGCSVHFPPLGGDSFSQKTACSLSAAKSFNLPASNTLSRPLKRYIRRIPGKCLSIRQQEPRNNRCCTPLCLNMESVSCYLFTLIV